MSIDSAIADMIARCDEFCDHPEKYGAAPIDYSTRLELQAQAEVFARMGYTPNELGFWRPTGGEWAIVPTSFQAS